MKRKALIAILLTAVIPLFACDITYTLDGKAIVPGTTLPLTAGSTHTLRVVFTEDHRNCAVPAEDTIFLLNDEKWKTGKDHLPLTISQNIVWKSLSSNAHEAVITFTAGMPGSAALEVLRECSRGGYDETLHFTVK